MTYRRLAGGIALAIGLTAGRLSAQAHSEADSSFRAFLPSFEAGLIGMLNGDTTLWFANASHADDVTLFTPFGALVQGWTGVAVRYRFAASRMKNMEAKLAMEYVTIAASGDLAYIVVVERSDSHGRDNPELQHGVTRATNVFRREAGQWKLMHRHMDHLPLDGKPPSD